MDHRYIELSSAYRDRNQYPNQSDFAVSSSFNNTGEVPNIVNAKDPVSASFPEYTFTIGSANTGTYSVGYGTTATNIVLTVPNVVTPFYYVGYDIDPGDGSQIRRIVAYNPSTATVTVDTPFSSAPSQYRIWDPSLTAGSYYIHAQPVDFWGITHPTSLPTTLTSTNQQVGHAAPLYKNVFTGYFLYNANTKQSVKITGYDPETRLFQINAPFSTTPSIGDVMEVRKVNPVTTTTIATAVNGTNTMTLNADVYGNSFLYINPSTSDPYYSSAVDTNFSQYVYKIMSFGTTGGVIDYKKVVLDKSIALTNYNGSTLVGRAVEILSFTRDNYQPYMFSGTRLSQEAAVCHEMELINLILPNIELQTGGRTSYYPYFYVTLESDTMSYGNSDSIYSNNPNSKRATFLCPINDISNPNSTQFLKIDSGGMKQKLKFNPKDPMHFRIYLPDGTPFTTEVPDNKSPLPPNPLLQITAVFEIKRL